MGSFTRRRPTTSRHQLAATMGCGWSGGVAAALPGYLCLRGTQRPLPPRPPPFLRPDGLAAFDSRRSQGRVRGMRSGTRRPGWGTPSDDMTWRGAALPGRGQPVASLFSAGWRHPASDDKAPLPSKSRG